MKFELKKSKAPYLVCTVFSALLLTSCSTVDQITGVTLDVQRVEQMIEDGVLDQGGFSVTATCPDPMSGQVGDTRTCQIVDEYGETTLVDVTIQNDNGDVVWKVQ
jgi:hypothetical protein